MTTKSTRQRWRNGWNRVTQPAATIHTEEQRQQASLVAALAFALLFVGTIVVIIWMVANPDFRAAPYIALAITGANILSYVLSRTKYYQTSAFLIIGMLLFTVGAIIFTAPGPMTKRMLALNFLVVAILLTSILLTVRFTLLVSGISILGTAIFFYVPGAPFEVVYSYMVFIVISAALLIMSTIIRNNSLQARQEAETALRESERFRTRILETSPLITYVFDIKQQKNIFANQQIAAKLDYSPEQIAELGDQFLATMLHPEDAQRVAGLLSRWDTATDDDIFFVEYRIKHADGTWHWFLGTDAVFERDAQGRVQQIIGTALNITARKEVEEALRKSQAQLLQAQKMEAVGRLAGGIAHDFNNILVPIIGYVDLGMMELSPDEQLYADLQRVRKAAERAAALTRQILAFSRQQILDMRVLDLNEVSTEFRHLIQRLIGEDIELRTLLAPALYQVKADKVQIEQVLLNLVVNARDAMPQGGKLTIETANVYLDEEYVKKYAEAQPPGHYVMLAVSDTGHGMDAEVQSQIFEPFFTTKEQGKGSGLGLATIFGIVKQHGGNIWVYSEPGEGTTFKIYLPQVEETALPAPKETRSPTSVYGTETILVVEDEGLVRNLVCESLAAYGYKIIEAKNPTEGLRLATETIEPIHLLFTDVIMPKMNGQELYQKVVSLHRNIKVLYMSGYTDNVIVHHGILNDEVNFLQKPFTVQTLTHKIREVLS